MPLEQHQIDRAKELLRHQWPMSRAARAIGTNYNVLRAALDPVWKQRRKEADRQRYIGFSHTVARKPDNPDDVLSRLTAERDKRLDAFQTISQRLFGDPSYSRSALGQKRANSV